jgi:hypothetical protein
MEEVMTDETSDDDRDATPDLPVRNDRGDLSLRFIAAVRPALRPGPCRGSWVARSWSD